MAPYLKIFRNAQPIVRNQQYISSYWNYW